MISANDNKPPTWELISELHFLCEDFSTLSERIAALPLEQKTRFTGDIVSISARLNTIHDLLEKL